jgi:glycosyltransferase involved in cell wall biosynthesis
LQLLGTCPYVVTLHRGDILRYPDLPRAEQALIAWSLRGAARVVAVSQWLKRLAEENIPDIGAIDCIHNGLDVDPTHEITDAVGSADLAAHLPSRFFLIVANLAHYKGQDVAIKAWSRVRARHPDVHLLIVGEPRDHWETCENLISDLGVGDVVRLLGPRSNPDVLWLMRRALGLIAPSRSEGFSMVVIEAALNGLPVIATRIEPFMEFVGDDAMGLTFPVDDAEALADIVERGLADPAAMAGAGEALRQRAQTHFTSAVMAAKYEALFQEIIAKEVRAAKVAETP